MEYIEIEKVAGKTIKIAKESDNEELIVIVFTDDTYTSICQRVCYDF